MILLTAHFALAMDVIELSGGGPYRAQISDHAINRIVFPWAATELIVQKQAPIDTKLAGTSLYISLLRPISGNVDLYILFDGHDPISLSLTPAQISGETVLIKAPHSSPIKALSFEKTSPYERAVKELIKKMAQSDLPPGYAVEEARSQDISPWKEATLRLRRIYGGSTFSGEIYEILNQSPGDMTITEEEILEILGADQIRAMAIASRNLKPDESALIYIVRSKNQD